MKKFALLLIAAASLIITSCSKDEGIADNPTTGNLSKQWFVRVQGPASTSNYSLFSTRTLTVVTSYDALGSPVARTLSDTLVLDDHELLNPTFRANVRITVANRTFGAGEYKNWNNPSDSIIVKEGSIIRDGGRSRTGATVDSIYLRYAFKSAPNTDYMLGGHARTGFVADEY